MAVDYIKGKDLMLFVQLNGVNYPIAHSTDCDLELTGDIQETTTKNNLRGKTFNYTGKYTWVITMKGFTNTFDVPNVSVIQDAIIQATKLFVTFTDQENIMWYGDILVTSYKVDSPFAGISTFSQNMQGTGELTKVTTDIPPIPLPGGTVKIIDQDSNIVAEIVAPGMYSVLIFNIIDCGGAVQPLPNLIITAGE